MVHKNQAGVIQNIQCSMDSNTVMRMKSGERFLALHWATMDIILNIYNNITVCFTNISIYYKLCVSIKTTVIRA